MTTDAPTTCPCCAHRTADLGIACSRCRDLARRRLVDILEFYALAEGELEVGRGGGGRSTGRSLGIRIDALDFVAGHDVLPRLGFWERDWRETRDLSRQPERCRIDGRDHPTATLAGTVDFLQVHLTWAYTEHPAVDEFHGDLAQLHGQAANDARVASPKVHVVSCPSTVDVPQPDEHGATTRACGNDLVLRDLDLEAHVRCDECATSWQVRRLLLVAAADSEAEVWVAEDDVALIHGISTRVLRKWAKAGRVLRKGGRYELASVRGELAVALAEVRFRRAGEAS